MAGRDACGTAIYERWFFCTGGYARDRGKLWGFIYDDDDGKGPLNVGRIMHATHRRLAVLYKCEETAAAVPDIDVVAAEVLKW